MGRLVREPEVRYTSGTNPTAVCRYTLAVNRAHKRDGEPDADFINVVAFSRRGEFAGKYFKKGMMVAVVGELRVSSYTDKDGNKRWSTDVVVTEQHFCGSKQDNQQAPATESAPAGRGYGTPSYQQQSMGPDDWQECEGDEDLPF